MTREELFKRNQQLSTEFVKADGDVGAKRNKKRRKT